MGFARAQTDLRAECYASGMVSTRRQGRHWKAWTAGRLRMAGSVAKNVIGCPHLEQIRTGGLSFATQTIAKMPGGIRHNRRMLRGVHLGATTGVYRNLARFCDKVSRTAIGNIFIRGTMTSSLRTHRRREQGGIDGFSQKAPQTFLSRGVDKSVVPIADEPPQPVRCVLLLDRRFQQHRAS